MLQFHRDQKLLEVGMRCEFIVEASIYPKNCFFQSILNFMVSR